MMKFTFTLLIASFFSFASMASARAAVALLLEEPFGTFGAMNPTGHSAIYLDRVCAETPTSLRLCRPGEAGVVLSRYHRIDGYDWLAIPLIPYLYAVDSPDQIPLTANLHEERRLRNLYRRKHLLAYVPDDPHHEFPPGDWIQLVGAAYDRRIWGFEVDTTLEQDRQLIDAFNNRANISHFNLFFNNCANFSEKVMNFYYPHSVRRNFIADGGLMTPKQAARSLVKYSREHPAIGMRPFVIEQVPGSIKHSTPVDGVTESLIKSKKYVVPLAFFSPEVTGGILLAYLSDGRFHPNHDAPIFDPRLQPSPFAPDFQYASVLDASHLEPADSSDKATATDGRAEPAFSILPGADSSPAMKP
jgi:hypothetical protein